MNVVFIGNVSSSKYVKLKHLILSEVSVHFMTNISNLSFALLGRLETSSGTFYDFDKIVNNTIC